LLLCSSGKSLFYRILGAAGRCSALAVHGSEPR
jgi:hypothetical protein